jgi:hypothetical protein
MSNESLEWAVAEIRILKRELVQLRATFLRHVETTTTKKKAKEKSDDTKT